jgi:hypothetical protein
LNGFSAESGPDAALAADADADVEADALDALRPSDELIRDI